MKIIRDKEVLVKHKAYYKGDTEFASRARLLQCIWREKKGLERKKDSLGNYLPIEYAKRTKANFLTEKIRTLVQYEIYRSKSTGKLIKEPRIWNNLLSSQPLCFNLFGELHYDLPLASKYFSKLFPDVVTEVTDIMFEHSPGRRDSKYTGDRSAFDVFVECMNDKKEKCFLGIEVKYSESMREDKKKAQKTFDDHKETYLRIANSTKVFPSESIDKLKDVPYQQIWRDHLLALSLKRDYDKGAFVFMYPGMNKQCQSAIFGYMSLIKPSEDEKVAICPMTLEQFIDTLIIVKKNYWTKELKERYLGFDAI